MLSKIDIGIAAFAKQPQQTIIAYLLAYKVIATIRHPSIPYLHTVFVGAQSESVSPDIGFVLLYHLSLDFDALLSKKSQRFAPALLAEYPHLNFYLNNIQFCMQHFSHSMAGFVCKASSIAAST